VIFTAEGMDCQTVGDKKTRSKRGERKRHGGKSKNQERSLGGAPRKRLKKRGIVGRYGMFMLMSFYVNISRVKRETGCRRGGRDTGEKAQEKKHLRGDVVKGELTISSKK